MILPGSKCILRPWRHNDGDALAAIANNPAVARNLMNRFPHPYTRADAEAWLLRFDADPGIAERRFAVEVDGVLAGGIGNEVKEDVLAHTAAFGYWLGEPFWGRGIATEAVRLFLPHLWSTPAIERIEAGVYAWNPASARVLEKNGFRLEGRLRRAVCRFGEYTDMLVYGLLRGD
jgi:RimJ/RimL family protein N-acetyltransferase